MSKTRSDPDIEAIADFQFSKMCEFPDGCDESATCAVWCDHHRLGCFYEGYRCDIHRNLLALETRRMIDHLLRGGEARCLRCEENITGTEMRDHLRWIAL